VDRLTQGGVVHVQVVADEPHHHLAAVEADPRLDLDSVRTADLLGILAHPILYGQGGVAGPHRVVLMGDRGAEQGHDPVAEHAADYALIAVDGVNHDLDRPVEQPLGVLGVQVPNQLG
jgi:hypothetical protein